MTVAVVFPWRAGCPWREASYEWTRARYQSIYPDWEQVEGRSPDGPFSRAAAILDGASRTNADILVVADADVWCDPSDSIRHANRVGWAVPHLNIHRLSDDASRRYMAGHPLAGLDLDRSNRQDSKPYRGNETGTLVVIRRDVLDIAPPDRRFVGWGQEDNAWGDALNCLIGQPWRGTDDLVHLWHPPQERLNRVVGNEAGRALARRYRRARRQPAQMRALIEEARCSTSLAS